MKLYAMRKKNQESLLGSSGFGVEVLEKLAPILANLSRLIECAKAQIKYCLQKNPVLANANGLIYSAIDLVDSLELITIAAEAVIKDQKTGIPKLVAVCNLVT
jgi:hypothetical protein